MQEYNMTNADSRYNVTGGKFWLENSMLHNCIQHQSIGSIATIKNSK